MINNILSDYNKRKLERAKFMSLRPPSAPRPPVINTFIKTSVYSPQLQNYKPIILPVVLPKLNKIELKPVSKTLEKQVSPLLLNSSLQTKEDNIIDKKDNNDVVDKNDNVPRKNICRLCKKELPPLSLKQSDTDNTINIDTNICKVCNSSILLLELSKNDSIVEEMYQYYKPIDTLHTTNNARITQENNNIITAPRDKLSKIKIHRKNASSYPSNFTSNYLTNVNNIKN